MPSAKSDAFVTISAPFQVNPIGTFRGVPSLASRSNGSVAGEQFLADRSVQNLGDFVRLHGSSLPLSFLVHPRLMLVFGGAGQPPDGFTGS